MQQLFSTLPISRYCKSTELQKRKILQFTSLNAIDRYSRARQISVLKELQPKMMCILQCLKVKHPFFLLFIIRFTNLVSLLLCEKCGVTDQKIEIRNPKKLNSLVKAIRLLFASDVHYTLRRLRLVGKNCNAII